MTKRHSRIATPTVEPESDAERAERIAALIREHPELESRIIIEPESNADRAARLQRGWQGKADELAASVHDRRDSARVLGWAHVAEQAGTAGLVKFVIDRLRSTGLPAEIGDPSTLAIVASIDGNTEAEYAQRAYTVFMDHVRKIDGGPEPFVDRLLQDLHRQFSDAAAGLPQSATVKLTKAYTLEGIAKIVGCEARRTKVDLALKQIGGRLVAGSSQKCWHVDVAGMKPEFAALFER